MERFTTLLAKRGHQVYLAGTASGIPRRNTVDGVVLLSVIPYLVVRRMTIVQFGLAMLNLVASLLVCMGLIVTLRPSIVVMETAIPVEPVLGGVIACKLLKRKYVIDYQDHWEEYLRTLTNSTVLQRGLDLVGRIAVALYNGARNVIVVTPGFYQRLRQRGVKNLSVIPNGADVTTFHPRPKAALREKLGFDKNGFVLVYTGLVGIYYRLDVVMHATSLLVRGGLDNIQVFIAGSGLSSDIRQVTNLANSLGIGQKVKYLGIIRERERLAEIDAAADVGLIPLDEGEVWRTVYPIKYFEYASSGLPVVASIRSPAIFAEMLDKSKTGLVTEPRSPSALAATLKRLYEDSALRETMGEAARSFVLENFDFNRNFEGFLNVLMSD